MTSIREWVSEGKEIYREIGWEKGVLQLTDFLHGQANTSDPMFYVWYSLLTELCGHNEPVRQILDAIFNLSPNGLDDIEFWSEFFSDQSPNPPSQRPLADVPGP